MTEQPKRLSTRERQALQPHVEAAQRFTKSARLKWEEIGDLLDKFESRGHSQCCPIGGMHMAGRNGYSGTTPCPCGWDSPESVEEVLRRMIKLFGERLGTLDLEAADVVTDALAALNRVPR